MTINTTDRKDGPYIGDDAQQIFPFAFKVFRAEDLLIVVLDTTTGVETSLTLNSDYTASLNGNQNVSPGGSITTTDPLESGLTLTITSALPYLQPVDITNNGGFYPDVINSALDRLTIFCQQLAEKLGRAILGPVSDSGGSIGELPSAEGRANQYLVFDANGAVSLSSGTGADAGLRGDLASNDPSLGASLVDGVARTVDSIGELRQVPAASNDRVNVFGYYAAGDGGGGAYWLDPSDTTSADNGGTVIVANDGGRWKLQHRGVVDIRQFGAVPDGDESGSGTDSAASINAALSAAGLFRGTVTASGSYRITAELAMSSTGVTFDGGNQWGTKLIQTTDNANVFNVTAPYCQIRNVSWYYPGAATAGANGIDCTNAGLVAENFVSRRAHKGVYVHTVGGSKMSKFECLDSVYSGIHTQSCTDCVYSDFLVVTATGTNHSGGGLRLEDKTEAIFFTNADIIGGVRTLDTTAAAYAANSRPAYNKFTNIYFDSGVNACLVYRMVETEFHACWFSGGRSGVQPGVSVEQSDSIKFVGGQAFNCGTHGARVLSTCNNIQFLGFAAESNSTAVASGSAHGIFIQANTNDFTITGGKMKNGLWPGGQQGYGVFIEAGASDRYVVRHNLVSGNVTGGVSDGGAGANKDVAANY